MALPESTSITRASRDGARLYGAEARRHFAECAWAEVHALLEQGWARVRRDDTPWSAVLPDVYAGWVSIHADQSVERA